MDENRYDPCPNPGLSEDPDLTRAILARTSGSPCRRLEALACDLVDGMLAPAQASLAQAHLDHCPACRTLLTALENLKTILPTLAQAEPGPALTAQVLQATLPATPPTFRTTWIRLMRRPRICLEAAYLGAVAGFISLHAPLPALHNLGDSALVMRLGTPAGQLAPALQASRSKVKDCGNRAARTASQQAQRARSFWGEVVATLRTWLAYLKGTPPPNR